MKNLKKVLSLALAFAMVLGLCIGASAATQDVTTLADWSEVENKNAALLLNAFNIMQGNTDGTFAPNDNVTRAQAAKMLSVALWGGKDDVALYNGNNIGGYTDVVAGNWYMGYVNYMTAVKVMAGKGDAKFDPDGNVTGYELLKMCLIGLGYNPETEGLVGAGWDIKTMALAANPNFRNLTANTKVTDWNAPLTRMDAATIISNMIYRATVYYDLSTGLGGTITSKVVANDTSFGEDYLSMKKETGLLLANPYGSLVAIGDKDGEEAPIDRNGRKYKGENAIVTMAEYDEKGNFTGWSEELVQLEVASSFEQLGNLVTVFSKTGVGVIYVGMNDAAAVEPTFNKGSLTNIDSKTDILYLINNSDVTVNDENSFESIFEDVGAFNASKNKFNTAANAEISYTDTDGDGYIDLVKAYVFEYEDDGDIKTVTSTADSEKYGTVYMHNKTNWNEKRFEAAGSNAVKNDAVLANDTDFEAEKDDLYIEFVDDTCFGTKFHHGYVLELVEGKITRKNSDATTIYVDGAKYSNKSSVNPKVGTEGKFFILNDTVFKTDVQGVETSDTYALVYGIGYQGGGTGADKGEYTLEVRAVLPDGTDKVFNVATVTETETGETEATTKTVAELGNVATWISNSDLKDAATTPELIAYSLNSNGTLNLFMDTIATDTIAKDVTVSNGVAKVGTHYLSSKSVTYINTAETGYKWVVYKGLTAPSYTIDTNPAKVVFGDLYATDDGINYMAVSKTAAAGDESKGLFYLLGAPEVIDDKGTYEVKAYNGDTDKIETLQYTATADANVGKEGHIYRDFNTKTGFDSELAASATNAGFITNFADNTIRLVSLKTADNPETENTNEAELNDAIVLVTNKDTKYFLFGDDESTDKITAADVNVQMSNDDVKVSTTVGGYQAIVVEGKDDKGAANNTATLVIILENAKKIGG